VSFGFVFVFKAVVAVIAAVLLLHFVKSYKVSMGVMVIGGSNVHTANRTDCRIFWAFSDSTRI
jgi:hypothetical protein